MSDFLLFSPEIYHRLIERLNEALWPAQIAILALGALLVLGIARPNGGRAAAGLLALAWFSVAWLFHYERYATINWAALGFAALFALQGLLLLWSGVLRKRLDFAPGGDPVGRAGFGLLLFGLFVQPLLGLAAGRGWSGLELAGLLPDPTAVATLGALLTLRSRVPWLLLAIPLIWAALSGATARTLGEPLWPLVPLAGLLAFVLATWKQARG